MNGCLSWSLFDVDSRARFGMYRSRIDPENTVYDKSQGNLPARIKRLVNGSLSFCLCVPNWETFPSYNKILVFGTTQTFLVRAIVIPLSQESEAETGLQAKKGYQADRFHGGLCSLIVIGGKNKLLPVALKAPVRVSNMNQGRVQIKAHDIQPWHKRGLRLVFVKFFDYRRLSSNQGQSKVFIIQVSGLKALFVCETNSRVSDKLCISMLALKFHETPYFILDFVM